MDRLSPEKKKNAEAALRRGLSVRKVAEECGISRSSVQRVRGSLGEIIPAPREVVLPS